MKILNSRDVLISIVIIITSTLIGYFVSSNVIKEDKNASDFYYFSDSKVYIDPDSIFDRAYVVDMLEKNFKSNSYTFLRESLMIRIDGDTETELQIKLDAIKKIIDLLNTELIAKITSKYEYIQSTYKNYLNSVKTIINEQEELFKSYNRSDLGIFENIEIFDKQYEYLLSMNKMLFEKDLKYTDLNFLFEYISSNENYEIVSMGQPKVSSIPLNFFNKSKIVIIVLFFVVGLFISWILIELKRVYYIKKNS